MLLKIKNISLIIAVILSIYGIITRNPYTLPYMTFILGILLLTSGLIEFRKEQKQRQNGYMLIFVSVFLFFVSLDTFLLFHGINLLGK